MGDVKSFYGHLLNVEKGRKTNHRNGRNATKICIVIAITVSMMAVAVAAFLNQEGNIPKKTLISYSPEVVASFGDVGQYCSIAANPMSDKPPVIAFYNATSQDLNIAAWLGADWNVWAPFPTADNDGLYCSLALNMTGSGSNIAHISYYDATSGNLVYANSIGEGYVVDSSGDVGQYSHIDVQNVTGSIAISYYDNSTGNLKVAYNESGNTPWAIYTVDTYGDVGQYSDVLFMPMNDTMMVNYYNATDTSLKQAWAWDTGSGIGPWFTMTIDNPPSTDVGKWTSQAGTATGIWYSSWYDSTNGDLSYAYYYNESVMEIGTKVDTVGDVGQYTSIAVNSSGHAFISYYDNTSKDLKLAWNVSSGVWYNMTVDSGGDVGKYASIGIDSNDTIHIAYYDVSNGDLKYVKISTTEITFIPEFSDVLPPIIGIMAIIAISSVRKNRKKE